jgi:O-antigen ligase/Flp pilus assembly protein TadD
MAPLVAARRVLLALLLLCPLAEAPTGYDVLRLPLAAALGAALLALGPLPAPGRAGAAWLGVLAVQLLSLAATPDLPAGLRTVLTTAVGAAAYAAARPAPAEDLERTLALLAGVLLAVAVVQKAEAPSRPTASLLGNANYAGAVAAMLLPALAAAARGWTGRAGAVAAAALLLLSESRGGLLGAAAGAAIAGVRLWKAGRRPAAGLAAGLVLAAGAGGLAVRFGRDLSPERLETGTVRTEIWKGALRMAADRPLLGTGAGGFWASFPPYRSAEEARLTQKSVGPELAEVEDAHSSAVQAAAEGGLPGALAWLALAVAAGWAACRAGPDASGWAGAVVAFLVAGLFNTLSAFAAPVVLFGAALGRLEPGPGRPAPRPAVLALAAALAAGALWTAVARPHAWRLRFQEAVALEKLRRFPEAVEAYRAVLAERPRQAAALNGLAAVLLGAGRPAAEAEAVLRRALADAPHFYRTHYHLGLLHLAGGRIAEARAEFERASWLNEKHGPSRYGMGETFLLQGDVPGALPHLRAARAAGMDVGAALTRDHPATAGDPRLQEVRR